eukprot:scaffold288535_cov37-Prasinocladus_malaysianus.AAC.2
MRKVRLEKERKANKGRYTKNLSGRLRLNLLPVVRGDARQGMQRVVALAAGRLRGVLVPVMVPAGWRRGGCRPAPAATPT